MKKHLGMLILPAVVLAGACNRGEELRRDQQQYDVVQEGAGGAVTSTIHAPGEVMPPLTNTNADTTTEFMLPNITDTSQTAAPPGSLAETFPTEPVYSPPPQTAPRPAPPPQPAPQPVPQPPPPPPTTTTVEPEPEPQPPPTTTTVEPEPEDPEPDEPEPQPEPQPPPPPPTDTTQTDTSAP